jgi:hypothetical protein
LVAAGAAAAAAAAAAAETGFSAAAAAAAAAGAAFVASAGMPVPSSFFFPSVFSPAALLSPASPAKNALFEQFIYKNDHFAKTASGQT